MRHAFNASGLLLIFVNLAVGGISFTVVVRTSGADFKTLIFPGLIIAAGAIASFLVSLYSIRRAMVTYGSRLQELAAGTDDIVAVTHEIKDSSGQAAANIGAQSDALQSTSAFVEEISKMVERNSQSAAHTLQVSNACRETSASGKDSMNGLIQAIQSIQSSTSGIAERIQASNRELGEIVDIINEINTQTKVINDIVFQTRLLSFNASVEAARAGIHGKGFSVVAEEIGSLANLSGKAATGISRLLEDSVRKVQSIVQTTQSQLESMIAEGTERVSAGTSVATQCSRNLEIIVEQVSEVTNLANDITQASAEQAIGVSELANTIRLLEQMTTQNRDTTQKTAEMSSRAADRAEALSMILVKRAA